MFALLLPVEKALKQQRRWHNEPTLDLVNEMWQLGEGVIAVQTQTEKGRKRRIGQIAWSTQLREYRKRSRAELDDAREEEPQD